MSCFPWQFSIFLRKTILQNKCEFIPRYQIFLNASLTNSFITGEFMNRSSCLEVFCRKGVLRNFANSQKNTCARVFFLIKLQALGLQLYEKKETLAQVFSCEFYEISKNTFFQRTPLVAASGCSFSFLAGVYFSFMKEILINNIFTFTIRYQRNK